MRRIHRSTISFFAVAIGAVLILGAADAARAAGVGVEAKEDTIDFWGFFLSSGSPFHAALHVEGKEARERDRIREDDEMWSNKRLRELRLRIRREANQRLQESRRSSQSGTAVTSGAGGNDVALENLVEAAKK